MTVILSLIIILQTIMIVLVLVKVYRIGKADTDELNKLAHQVKYKQLQQLNKQLDLANAGIMISEAPPEEDSSKQESTPIGFTTNR